MSRTNSSQTPRSPLFTSLGTIIVVLVALIAGACSSAESVTTDGEPTAKPTTVPEPTPTTPVEDEIMVTPAYFLTGDVVALPLGMGQDFNNNFVAFTEVADDRCPTHEGVDCGWEGALRATLTVTPADKQLTVEGFENGSHGSNPHVWFQSDDEWFRLTAVGFSDLGEDPVLSIRIDEADVVSITDTFGEPELVAADCRVLHMTFEGDQVFVFRIVDPIANAMQVGEEITTRHFLPGYSDDERPGTLYIGNASAGSCQSSGGTDAQLPVEDPSGDAVYRSISGAVHQVVVSETDVTVEFIDLVLANESDPNDVYVLNHSPVTVSYARPQ